MEITNKTRIEALDWFKTQTLVRRAELSFKHYKNSSKLTADNVVTIWRRTTGGEWK